MTYSENVTTKKTSRNDCKIMLDASSGSTRAGSKPRENSKTTIDAS